MEHEASFVPLLVVVVVAVLAPIATSRIKRVRIPTVVGEIIAGIIVGQSVLGLVTHDQISGHPGAAGLCLPDVPIGTRGGFWGFDPAAGHGPGLTGVSV